MYVRKNLLNLSSEELRKLREGFEKLYTYPHDDNRGFLFWAGLHGYPRYNCPHHQPDFLTWHRAFVLGFELALQDVLDDDEFGLPYWDWTSSATSDDGIPNVLSAETYDGDKPNPLRRARIVFPPSIDRDSTRDPSPDAWLVGAAQQARASLAQNNFTAFQQLLESGHDGLHGWVGGDMGNIGWAAFDPLFWFHHCNIDRLWADWQEAHPTANVPQSILNSPLQGFAMRGEDVIDYRELGYEYGSSHSGADIGPNIDGLLSGDGTVSQSFSLPATGFRTAELLLTQVEHPRNSLQLRIFINQSDANVGTTLDSDHHAASRYVFGHGQCTGLDEGHCDWRRKTRRMDPRGLHHLTPFDLRLDISESLAKVSNGDDKVDVTVVLADSKGDPVPGNALRFNRMELFTRD